VSAVDDAEQVSDW